jgi:hypothetical protein
MALLQWFRGFRNSIGRGNRPQALRAEDELDQRWEAARNTLSRYERDRYPFVLFLRNFDFQLIFGNPAFPGAPSGVYFLRDRIHKALKHGVGVVAIAQESGEFPFMGSAKASAAPLLWLEDKDWESVVDRLIGAANIIVTEVQSLSKGVAREFEMIQHHRKQAETVVVLPSPDLPFESLELLPQLSTFPRVVHAAELPLGNPLRSFVLMDLVARTYQIARASAYERLAADLNGDWQKRFPVTFDRVGQGYDELGKFYLNRRALALATARFQKALLAASARGDPRRMAEQHVNLARVPYSVGDLANAHSILVQARDSLAKDGYKFDVEAIEAEFAISLIRHVMRHYP